jgi:segregation and condensation protein B
MSIDRARIASIVESLIFVSDKPLSFRKIRTILEGVPGKELQELLDELKQHYRAGERGIVLEEVADGFQLRTPPENQEWVKMLIEYKPMRLSRAAMETLAIIAYRQPTTKTDVEAIRGVDSTSAVAKLLELGLLKILGRKEIPGRPFVYGTTPEFLEVFNLSSLGDLPSLREIEDLSANEIDAFTDRLSESAGENVQPSNEGDAAAPELDHLEQAGEPREFSLEQFTPVSRLERRQGDFDLEPDEDPAAPPRRAPGEDDDFDDDPGEPTEVNDDAPFDDEEDDGDLGDEEDEYDEDEDDEEDDEDEEGDEAADGADDPDKSDSA